MVMMRAFGEKLVEAELCKTEQVDNLQNTEGVYKKHGEEPPWLAVARCVPQRQALPNNRPQQDDKHQTAKQRTCPKRSINKPHVVHAPIMHIHIP